MAELTCLQSGSMQQTKIHLDRFLEVLPALLPEHLGKFALICQDQVDVFDTLDEAMEAVPEGCNDGKDFLIIRIEPQHASFAV